MWFQLISSPSIIIIWRFPWPWGYPKRYHPYRTMGFSLTKTIQRLGYPHLWKSPYGGFHGHGGTAKWMVSNGKSHLEMDDDLGVALWLRKPPNMEVSWLWRESPVTEAIFRCRSSMTGWFFRWNFCSKIPRFRNQLGHLPLGNSLSYSHVWGNFLVRNRSNAWTTNLEVSGNGDTPSHHPFQWYFHVFPIINHPAIGIIGVPPWLWKWGRFRWSPGPTTPTTLGRGDRQVRLRSQWRHTHRKLSIRMKNGALNVIFIELRRATTRMIVNDSTHLCMLRCNVMHCNACRYSIYIYFCSMR